MTAITLAVSEMTWVTVAVGALALVNLGSMLWSRRGEETPEIKRVLHDVQQTRQAVQSANENTQEQFKELLSDQKSTALGITTIQERMISMNTIAQQNLLAQTTTNMSVAERIGQQSATIEARFNQQAELINQLDRRLVRLETRMERFEDKDLRAREKVARGGEPVS